MRACIDISRVLLCLEFTPQRAVPYNVPENTDGLRNTYEVPASERLDLHSYCALRLGIIRLGRESMFIALFLGRNTFLWVWIHLVG